MATALRRICSPLAGFLLFAGSASPQKIGVLKNVSGLTFRRVWTGSDVPNAPMGVSPDGGRLAFIQDGNIFVRDLTMKVVQQITDLNATNRALGSPIWSPDGKQLAILSGTGLQIVVLKVDGSGIRTIYRSTEENAIFPNDWSPDGKRILVATRPKPGNSQGILWINVSDGAVQRVSIHAIPYSKFFVSPDGRHLAFSGSETGAALRTPSNIRVIASDGSDETIISKGVADEDLIGWTPDGKDLLTTRGSALWAIPVANGKMNGQPFMAQRDLATDYVFSRPTRDMSLVAVGITRSGTLFYQTRRSTSDIYAASMDPVTGKVTSPPQPLPLSHGGFNALPRLSPDGRRIFYHMVEWTPENFIYSFDTGKDEPVALHVPSAGICWTRDGASIVNNPSTTSGAMTRFDVSTGQSTLLFPEGDRFSGLSCGGDLLATQTQSGIHVRNIQNGPDTVVYPFSPGTVIQTAPVPSHDDRSVAFIARPEAGFTSLLVVPSAGGKPRELARLKSPAEFQPIYWGVAWSPDNRFVYFLKRNDRGSPYVLFRIPAAGGVEERVGLEGADMRDLDIALDGTRIVFSLGAPEQPEIWAMDNFLP